MNLPTPYTLNLLPKKAYKTPKLTALGTVRQLTLKSGSLADGFGTFA